MTEAESYLKRKREQKFSQSFFNSLMLVGFTATAVAIVLLFVSRDETRAETTVILERVQSSLKVACDAAEGQPLPATARSDCAAANENKLPEKLQEDVDDPERQDAEDQDAEVQDPETQDSEVQDPEVQDSEAQEPELPDEETNDPDPDDPEVQEPEVQEPEIQDPEEQNAPICEPGYHRSEFVWSGPDGQPDTGDEDTWLLCVKDK